MCLLLVHRVHLSVRQYSFSGVASSCRTYGPRHRAAVLVYTAEPRPMFSAVCSLLEAVATKPAVYSLLATIASFAKCNYQLSIVTLSLHVSAPAGRSAPGSAAARFTDGQKQQAGGSPGHTPFPSKAKVRAATAAAGAAAASRSAAAPAAAAAAAPKGPSHKKEMARAAAHSALKRYSKSVAAEAEGPDAGTPSPTAGSSVRRGSTSPSPTIPNVSSRLMQPTAASSAKARYSGASEQPDSEMWSPPSAHEAAAAAAAGSSRPRLASKIVVPSPAAPAAGDVSLKALKRSIKSKVAEKAHATLKEAHADTLGVSVVALLWRWWWWWCVSGGVGEASDVSEGGCRGINHWNRE